MIINVNYGLLLLATAFTSPTDAYGNGSPGCMDPAPQFMGDGSKGTGGFELTAFHPDGSKAESFQSGDRLKLKLSNSKGPYTGFLVHAVADTPGKKYENVQGRFIQLPAEYRYPNKGCSGKPEAGVTQRSQRVKQPRDSDSFTWVADLTDDKVKSVTFYAIGVTEDSWFGLDESPIMLSLPIANTMRVRDNSTIIETGANNGTNSTGKGKTPTLESAANSPLSNNSSTMLLLSWLIMLLAGAFIHPQLNL